MKQLKTAPSKRELTHEQRVFCRLVAVENVKPSQAYMQVFKGKQTSAYTLAGRLLKKVEIQTEIKRLQTKVEPVREKAHLWSVAERKEKLQEWAEASVTNGKINDATRCIDILNKMDGAYDMKINDEPQGSACEQREMAADREERMQQNILSVLYEQRERTGAESSVGR